MRNNRLGIVVLMACLTGSPALAAPGAEFATTDEGIVGTYRKTVPDIDFDASRARDEKNKPRVAQRQRQLLEERYDLSEAGALLHGGSDQRAEQRGRGAYQNIYAPRNKGLAPLPS